MILERLAKAATLRSTRNRRPLAQGGIPQVLAMEEPPRMAGEKEGSKEHS
jgi:hypothetical protein